MEGTEENKKNLKLYPIYKMISWDLLFYFPIIFLFFTQIKGLSAADVLLVDAVYLLFKSTLLIPESFIIERIGKRNSLIIGNLFNALSILIYIISKDFGMIIIGEVCSAIAFNIKGICEANMLYDSLSKNEKRGDMFSKIDGKATSLYYYISAVSSVIAGFLFKVNGYIPMVLCLITNTISMLLAFGFEEIVPKREKKRENVIKELKNLKTSFKNIFSSVRLRKLIIFGAFFSGIMLALVQLRSSLLKDINVQPQYFGIIFGVFEMISGMSARRQEKIHKKFRNRTLTVLAVPVVFSIIALGMWCNIEFDFKTTMIGVLIAFAMQFASRGPFYTLIKKYLNNFTNTSLRAKISTGYNLLENIFRAMICFSASLLLRFTTTANTFIIIGCVATMIVILMLDGMRKKVGLKPEEYEESEIKILDLK